jgi:tripeptide aminopeptidase
MNHTRETVLDRFLRYVVVDTRSDERSAACPSTPGQLVLMQMLAAELRGMHAADVSLDDNGYLMATIPATRGYEDVPAIGFIAHVDTSPEMRGDDVRPLVHRRYDGRDIVLPDDPAAILRSSDDDALAAQIGNDIVTAAGLTLLGADDKAGVAEIMTAAAHLLGEPEIAHGPIRIAFTPDEEIGRGADRFDVARFGAVCAYTLDGGSLGELEYESFSADAMTLTFGGFNTHPGYAKGRMVNAIRLAARFIDGLPADRLTPETTSGYEGFVHPYQLEAAVDRTKVKLLVRDFASAGLREKESLVEALAREVVAAQPGATVEVEIRESYRNMREVLEQHPHILECARRAMRRAGIEPVERPIRGGTDGSRLSFMGLPTPNLFAGEHNFHSRLEWVSVQDMEKAVDVVLHLCQVWGEDARAGRATPSPPDPLTAA